MLHSFKFIWVKIFPKLMQPYLMYMLCNVEMQLKTLKKIQNMEYKISPATFYGKSECVPNPIFTIHFDNKWDILILFSLCHHETSFIFHHTLLLFNSHLEPQPPTLQYCICNLLIAIHGLGFQHSRNLIFSKL